jgi:hypothetical protein
MVRNKLFVHWFFAFFIAVFIVSNSHYKSSNDDSKYYSDLVVRYQNENWQKLLTPLWGVNYYSYAPSDYMRDQLPGQLILGVGVSKLGIPAQHALHVLGMVFQILSIFLLVKIASLFISSEKASALYYGILLTPMAFSYNIRGNHEHGIMFFCFLSLYAGLKLSKSRYWSIVSAISAVMLLMIKGPFFIFGLILTAFGFCFTEKKSSFGNLIFNLVLSSICILLAGYFYEYLYLKITGVSFFSEFYRIQIELRAMTNARTHSYFVQKLLNFNYYFVNYFTYSLPWCFLGAVAIITNRNKLHFKSELKTFLTSRLSNCLILSAFVFCLVFTMSDRTATRYIFPAYYLFSAWTILLLLNISEQFRNIHVKFSKWGLHLIAPLLWLLAIVLHFI